MSDVQGKTSREVYSEIFKASALSEPMIPNKPKVEAMLKIKSNQIRDRVYTIGSNNVQFDAHGEGKVPACYRAEVEAFIGLNQGFFRIVEEETIIINEPVVKEEVRVKLDIQARVPAINISLEGDFGEDEDLDLTEDQKKFLAILGGQLNKDEEVTKPTIVHKKSPGRPKKK